MNEPRHIDLTVPTGWNQCTTAQLELIAQILLIRTMTADRYHPYDPLQFKAECFFALAGIHPLPQTEPDDSSGPGDQTYLMRFIDRRPWWKRLFSRSRHGDGKGPFPMQVWQVHSFIDQHLKWLDSFTDLWIFPYPTFGYDFGRWRVCWWRPRWLHFPVPCLMPVRLEGPNPLFDGFSWQQYRFASEWLSVYTSLNDQQTTFNGQQSMSDELQTAREGFLKALFNCTRLSYTPRRLRRMRPDQFQLCLIWWQSMMKEMQRKYSKCFKSAKSGSGSRQSLPIDLYTRSAATLQDKYHLTEDDINQQPCRVILQHLDDMAREAEEIEKMRRKK